MFATCVTCAAPLGANEALEHFPVGRRLAWDASKGFLWVVCRRCERWNLTPIEQRWEAIEEAERLYRDTPTRASTDNVGLARLPDGTDLVRVGRPQRPEMAAWRYGDQFGRRRRRALVGGGIAGAAGVGGLAALGVAGLPLAGIGVLLGSLGWTVGLLAITTAGGGTLSLRNRWLRDDEGRFLLVTPNDLQFNRLVAAGEEEGGWALRLGYRARRDAPTRQLRDLLNMPSAGEARLTGEAAMTAARQLLPVFNGRGARAGTVRDAVDTLGQLGTGHDTFRQVAARVRQYAARQSFGDTGSLPNLPRAVRLALEMAAHEDEERLALEGELAGLERAWRDAEEIARIADGLLEPPTVTEQLARLRGHVRARSDEEGSERDEG